MYSKLPVSSLESRALNNDSAAMSELVNRAENGLKRARFALERIANRKKAPPTTKPNIKTTTCNHTYWNWEDCESCRREWAKQINEIEATQDKIESRLKYV